MTRTTWSLLFAVPFAFGPAHADVLSYVGAADPSFTWKVGEQGNGYVNLAMTSQTWQGVPWQHTITVFHPAKPKADDVAVLVITGGSFRPTNDTAVYSLMANAVGYTVAVLWDIPNQPLFGNLREDALIAHTFVKALETGDESWPLLFPMTKSAVRAMDALQAYSEQAWGKRLGRFVVTGASKRGWTTWFTGAVDPRVAAIMPMVYDNLNIPAQMTHQMDTWGAYSEQIDDYTKLGLQAKLASAEGRQLASLIDPFTYRERITMPKLIICGTNDRYWAVDALNLYRSGLKGETYQLYVPNSGHGLQDISRVLSAVAGFVDLVGRDQPRPQLAWTHGEADGKATLRITAAGATKADLWWGTAEGGRFYETAWASVPMTRDGDAWTASVPMPVAGRDLVVFGEATFQNDGKAMPLSTELALHRPK